MISDKMTDRLNSQLNTELNAWYLYYSMAAYCKGLSLNGIGAWFDAQAGEEREHAQKIYDYLIEQDSPVQLREIEKPEQSFKSVIEVFEKTLAHEQEVTKSIEELISSAKEERDHATEIFLHWFITEQIEEEASVRDILDNLRLIKDSGEGLIILDRELGQRGKASA